MKVEIASFDPSLRNWGCVSATLDLSTETVTITGMNLIETAEDASAKKGVRQNSLDLASATSLSEGMREACLDKLIAFAEVPVGSQSARAMASYGICVGVLGGITIPLIQVTPAEVKKAAVGTSTATKREMIEWAVAKHPEAPWLTLGKGEKMRYIDKNEHLADAVAAIYAGLKTAEFKSIIKILRQHLSAS